MTSEARLAPQTARRVVGIADMVVSNAQDEILVTYALGSCLGVVIHDPVAGVGGLLHAMLPSSSVDSSKASANPARFVDTGVPTLFKTAYRLGAVKERIVVKVVGGASIANAGAGDTFQIGKRNLIALKKLLWKNGVMVRAHETGGTASRTVSLDVASGRTVVKSQGHEVTL